MPEIIAKLETSFAQNCYKLLLASESGKTFTIDFCPEMWSNPFYGKRISEEEIFELKKFLEVALWEVDYDKEDKLG